MVWNREYDFQKWLKPDITILEHLHKKKNKKQNKTRKTSRIAHFNKPKHKIIRNWIESRLQWDNKITKKNSLFVQLLSKKKMKTIQTNMEAIISFKA